MQVIVHGGAGSEPDEPARRRAVLESAAEAGASAETPLDAVERAVRTLESSPRFNAGVGGAVQSDGGIRTDAGVMTDDGEIGAACSMPGVEHAVTVARTVMEETPHVLVVGDHAVALADAFGIETDADLWSDRTRRRWAELDPSSAPATSTNDRSATGEPTTERDVRAELAWVREVFGASDPGGPGSAVGDGTDHDTVGAVAFDGTRLATATSTGGRWLALAGRVGDVPQVGSGFYCTPTAGASATGAGEDIARVALSRRVVDHVEGGLGADAAAERAIEEFADRTGSAAGVVAVDADGEIGAAYNSDAMQTAVVRR